MKNLKVGVIGGGSIAGYHVEGFRQAGAEVVAVADVNEDAARGFAEKYGIPSYFRDFESMLDAYGELDAVSIAVPNFLHRPLAIKALKAGLNVYCEKPPALNAAETEDMVNVAATNQKLLMFNFNNRARSEARALKGYIDNGCVGTINSVQSTWVRRNGIPGFGGWFTQKEKSGGGPVIDLLHMIDLGLYLMGYPEPDYVLARTFDDFMGNPVFKGPWGNPDRDNPMDVECACHGFITFKTGQCMSIRNSWAEMNEREEVSVTFQGTKAGARMRRLFRIDGIDETSFDTCSFYTVENGFQVNRDLIIPEDPSMGRLGSARNFIEVLQGWAEPLNRPDEAIVLMKIIDAIYRSAETGRPIPF